MNSAKFVDNKIQQLRTMVKESGMPLSEAIFSAAKLCVGWAYVFGAKGDYCDPENRRRRYSDKHPTIKTKCKNFSGAGTCNGCQWYPDGERTRFFDCRGFTYWILNKMCDWKLYGETTVTQWGKASNWKAKGKLSEGYPRDTIMCLFQYDNAEKKMIHTGFGYNDETCECQKGVEYHKPRDRKWTHWAVPVCIDGDIPDPQPGPKTHPTLRKGARGDDVREMQQKLLAKGEHLPRFGVDGAFGNETLAAVKNFQLTHGLVVDGICGPKTWAELDKE